MAMETMKTNRVLNGSTGTTWLGENRLANIKSIKATAEGEFEEYSVAGDYRTFWDYKGYKITGTLTLHKVDSHVLSLLKEAYRSGEMPTLKIITKLYDVQTKQSERVAMLDVALTKFDLANIEAKTLCTEEIPFQSVEYDVLEEIA